MLRSRLLRSLCQSASTSYSKLFCVDASEFVSGNTNQHAGLGASVNYVRLYAKGSYKKEALKDEDPVDPELEMELQVLREHNSTLMPLKGRKIYATVSEHAILRVVLYLSRQDVCT